MRFDKLDDNGKVQRMLYNFERIGELGDEVLEKLQKMVFVKNKLQLRWWKSFVSCFIPYLTWMLVKVRATGDVIKPAAIALCHHINQNNFSDAIVSLGLLSQSDLSNSDDIAVVAKASSTISPSSSSLSSITSTSSSSLSSSSNTEMDLSSSEEEADHPLFVAKYDYQSQTHNDMSFKKGDHLLIINDDDKDWWFARVKHSGQKGFIPSNYIAKFGLLDVEDWYFGDISCADAEKLLMQPSVDHGSFLVRKSGNRLGEYTLSLLNLKEVKHFKINKQDDENFYLTPKETFKTISELVAYYSEQTLPIAKYQHIKLKSVGLLRSHGVDVLKVVGESWETTKESIHFIKNIGNGAFGEVWEGTWNKNTPVAVKVLKTGTGSTDKFCKEVELLKQLSHPKIIQLYAVCTKEEPIYIITELMKHGSLLEYLKGNGRSLKHPQLIDMGAQVASAMAYLEEKSYVHRDVAARNVLVGENLICKIADFDFARITDVEEVYEAHTGAKFPIKWTAPEAIMYNRYSIKSDVWSFGIFLYELITYGRIPYPGMNNAKVIEQLQNGFRMSCPEGCPKQLYVIMTECWRDEAASRPTFKALQGRLNKFYVETEHAYLSHGQSNSTTLYKDEEGDKSKETTPQITHERSVISHNKSVVNEMGQNKEGQLPNNHVAAVEPLDATEWYFGDINHSEATKLLLQSQNPSGAFLIRTSSMSQSLVLSLRDNDTVKHYKIHQLGNYNYYIKRKLTFHSIQELVTHYKEHAGGLAQQLSDPCIQPGSYKDEWETDRKTLQFNKNLGMGNFSEVWSGLWKNSTPVAIKKLKSGKVDFVAKIEIMKKIYHPNLLKLYAVCTLEEPILIVTELMQHGALLDYLHKGAGLNLKLPQLIDMAAQIAGGMAYLEEHSYIHRDLMARNVLVGKRNLCKVSDSNIACVNKEDIYDAHEDTKFPVKWTAPEAAFYNKFSIKSDVWSFGIVMYELLTWGDTPYPEMSDSQVLEAVERGYHMPRPHDCPDVLYNIMLSCWKHEADNRPTFKHLKYQLEDYFVSAAQGAYKPVEQK